MSQLCVVISGPTIDEAREQIAKASPFADLLEFRTDRFHFSFLESIADLKNSASLPVIFTLRKKSQGGEYSGDEQERLERLRQLAALQPAYLDLEWDLKDFFEEMSALSPETKLICSYHDFIRTPEDLPALLASMVHERVSVYKIATLAHSSVDAMRMLCFVREAQKSGVEIIGICMGEYGVATRILAPVFGCFLSYAPLAEENRTAPGQLTAETLVERYRYKQLNRETEVYCLIGDPITRSPGHIIHNFVLGRLGRNAVYVKINVKPDELHAFLEAAKTLDFRGMSVTMPLKEVVLRELSEASEDAGNIGAINTLLFSHQQISGINTDGVGALNAIEEYFSVKGKRLVILGAGGAAKAVAWEAKQRGAELVILNRTLEKARSLAQDLDCAFGELGDFSSVATVGYDVLIDCTSLGMSSEKGSFPIDCSHMLSRRLVMDIIPGNQGSVFLEAAQKKDCQIIRGHQMLKHQAIKQAVAWYGDEVDEPRLKQLFEEAFTKIL